MIFYPPPTSSQLSELFQKHRFSICGEREMWVLYYALYNLIHYIYCLALGCAFKKKVNSLEIKRHRWMKDRKLPSTSWCQGHPSDLHGSSNDTEVHATLFKNDKWSLNPPLNLIYGVVLKVAGHLCITPGKSRLSLDASSSRFIDRSTEVRVTLDLDPVGCSPG